MTGNLVACLGAGQGFRVGAGAVPMKSEDSITVGDTAINILQGSITNHRAEVIVNGTGPNLKGLLLYTPCHLHLIPFSAVSNRRCGSLKRTTCWSGATIGRHFKAVFH